MLNEKELHVARCTKLEQSGHKQSKSIQNRAKRRELQQDAAELDKDKKNGSKQSKKNVRQRKMQQN